MLERKQLINHLLENYADTAKRPRSYLRRVPDEHKYLFAVNPKNEGFYLVWPSTKQPSVLDRNTFRKIVAEANAAHLEPRCHVYASLASYTGAGVEFYQIPGS